ncbi:MAG: hypothetical protein ABL999_20230 [Pyrinomonadaceae bacterium]
MAVDGGGWGRREVSAETGAGVANGGSRRNAAADAGSECDSAEAAVSAADGGPEIRLL